MNIKEYVKIQAEKCENAVMKEIFIDLTSAVGCLLSLFL
jgi:hypothetical protein